MKIMDYPLCCKAKVVVNFGGGHDWQRGEEAHTKQQVIAWLKLQMNRLKLQHGIRILVAMPTSTQPNAIAALEELGFYGHPDPKSCHNKGSKHYVSPFFMNLNEWDLRAFNRRYKPDEDKYKNKMSQEVNQIARDVQDRGAW